MVQSGSSGVAANAGCYAHARYSGTKGDAAVRFCALQPPFSRFSIPLPRRCEHFLVRPTEDYTYELPLVGHVRTSRSIHTARLFENKP